MRAEWYEKVLDAGSTFAGNITGYYDYKKATEGVNPVTGEKLEGHRIDAAVIDSAGYIPVIKSAKELKAYIAYMTSQSLAKS
ncbi:pre-toxin TG domain-containing protein [Bacillus sp. GM2]|uniref:pre-toxin TG domain-containing protein n=1 Tax=Bacillus TaxID=1386 RepID=UPI0003A14F97|nr:hypothetical protein BHT95_15665 [Bacillus paralicheniformis]TWM25102.1 putative ribonuclease YwqJ [Bacillus paralicheniformis]TWM56366.1 putative ribonuclease YwqJ [Bacillus paralicheniformis]